jgi:hypothetical protein
VNQGSANLPPGNENPIKHGMEINHDMEDIPPVYKNPIDDGMDTLVSPVTL